MRHTCATLWLAAGENPQWIARQLGHTTTEMLFRTYSRYVPNLTRTDGSAFDRLVTSAVHGGIEQQGVSPVPRGLARLSSNGG
jgi:integrase